MGRPRSASARKAALKAASELLNEGGFAKLTMDGIAARAGIGKRTLYRWWATKGAVAVEAFLAEVSRDFAFPTSDSALTDIKVQLRAVVKAYRGRAGKTVRELLALGQSDKAMLTTFFEGYIWPRREMAKLVLQRALANGEILADTNLEVAIDALYGPIFYRLLVRHADLDDSFADHHADIILRGISLRK